MAVSQTDVEWLERFKLKSKNSNTIVEKVIIQKDRSLEVTIRLNLLQLFNNVLVQP